MFLDTPINNNNKYIVAVGIETVLLFCVYCLTTYINNFNSPKTGCTLNKSDPPL